MRVAIFVMVIVAAMLLSVGCTPSTPVVDGTVTASGDNTSAIVSSDTTKPQMTKDQYLTLATGSTCAKTKHDVQGLPRQGWVKGMALTYAKTICNPTGDTYKVAGQPLGNANVDALAHYGLNPQTTEERVNTTFSLALGSAARESTWRWYVGKDANASNTDSSTCEAGGYQTSYNCRYNRDGLTINPSRDKLYKFFKADKSRCFATEYKSGLAGNAENLKNWGTGEGVTFQELSKQCPGFATEYHLMAIRERRTHYGPINIKKSEAKPVCTDMFASLRKAIKDNPSLCGKI